MKIWVISMSTQRLQIWFRLHIKVGHGIIVERLREPGWIFRTAIRLQCTSRMIGALPGVTFVKSSATRSKELRGYSWQKLTITLSQDRTSHEDSTTPLQGAARSITGTFFTSRRVSGLSNEYLLQGIFGSAPIEQNAHYQLHATQVREKCHFFFVCPDYCTNSFVVSELEYRRRADIGGSVNNWSQTHKKPEFESGRAY